MKILFDFDERIWQVSDTLHEHEYIRGHKQGNLITIQRHLQRESGFCVTIKKVLKSRS